MTEQHTVTLLMSEFVTHDLKRFFTSRPPGFMQAVTGALGEPGANPESLITNAEQAL
jgi:hypothetical protein